MGQLRDRMEQDVSTRTASDRERHQPDAGCDEAGVEADDAGQCGTDRGADKPGDCGH